MNTSILVIMYINVVKICRQTLSRKIIVYIVGKASVLLNLGIE